MLVITCSCFMKSVLTRHPMTFTFRFRFLLKANETSRFPLCSNSICPEVKQQTSILSDADAVWHQLTQGSKHTFPQTHTHTGQRHAALSFFPGCTLRGRCSPHNSVLSCQNASLLAAEYPVSLIGADRDCSPKPELRVSFIYFCTCTHAEFNEIHCRSVEAPPESQGLLLKWTSATLKRCMAVGESCACRYGLHRRWAPSEPLRISHSDRVSCLGVILKLFEYPKEKWMKWMSLRGCSSHTFFFVREHLRTDTTAYSLSLSSLF